jgi:hypothetical protein
MIEGQHAAQYATLLTPYIRLIELTAASYLLPGFSSPYRVATPSAKVSVTPPHKRVITNVVGWDGDSHPNIFGNLVLSHVGVRKACNPTYTANLRW